MNATTARATAKHRGLITRSVMLATIMQALDTTIANVALPPMQGSMGTTQDQISWVLTSYIVAAAICMPLIGSSIGISLVISYLAQRTQINHAVFTDFITPFSQALTQATESGAYDLSSAAGLLALNAKVTRQAAILAYLQDFRLMMFVTLPSLPLILLLRAPQKGTNAPDLHAVMD